MIKIRQGKGLVSINKSRIRSDLIVILFVAISLAAVTPGDKPALAEMDLADLPMPALIPSPPANMMFVLDDSGSMTYEILITGQYDGQYPNPTDISGEKGYCYIFDPLGDNARPETWRYMSAEGRKFWRSQYFGDNVLYYNPNVEYVPWTGYGNQSFPPADQENPKPHPTKSGVTTLDLDAASFAVKLKVNEVTESTLKIKHAHYFNKSERGDIYLVVIDGVDKDLKYYKVIETEGTDYDQQVVKIEKISTNSLPEGIAAPRDYGRERQNFANWFTYHRRREYIAKAALAGVIVNLHGVRVGILGINGKIIVPLKPADVKINGTRHDESGSLLKALFQYDSGGDTPLREGLNDVGAYYANNSSKLIHHGGDAVNGDAAPYFSQDEGGACQQSFAIMMTDGYYSTAGDLGVGNADGYSRQTEFDRRALEDNLSNTLADVAMYYYENDLSPVFSSSFDATGPAFGLPDYVPTSGFDQATHQHMVTFGVAFGVTGKLNPKNYKLNQIYTDDEYTINWPTKINVRHAQTIDDLWHATLNGRGQFFSADNPQEMTESLLDLTKTISGQLSGSASAVAVNGNQLYEEIGEDIFLFQCSYSNKNDIKEWIGDLKAYGFNAENGRFDTVNYIWSAAEQLQILAWNERKIATYNPVEKEGKAFTYENLTFDQKKALGWDEVMDSKAEQIAKDRMRCIKGQEIAGYRSLSQKLGDIVHSAPVFENNVIYVGGNDGMLHAFNAQKFDPKLSRDPALGDELFAYIPNLVFANLAELTSPDYDHKYFVDLTPTIKKGAGLLAGRPSAADSGFQTILVGGLGKGGKGYFALDITVPFSMESSEKAAQKVLWEFPIATDPDMGFSYSRPVVVRSYDKDHPWIVIFGNGYNSTSGNAVLYILDPAQSPKDGLLIKKINLAGAPHNGLSSPTAVDVNGDNVVDYVYVGDLKGNLWKFDLTAASVDQWTVAYHNGFDAQPLFQAAGPNNTVQSITSKPEVTLHPQFGYFVMFGTGKFLGNADFADDRVQSVYGIWDYGDDEDDHEYLGTMQRGNDGVGTGLDNVSEMKMANLLEQKTMDFEHTLPNGKIVNVRLLTDRKTKWIVEKDDGGQNPNPSTTVANHVGWYFDLSARERVDLDVLLRDGKLIVIGFIPDVYQCRPGGGDSMLMEIDAFSGGNLKTVQFDVTGGGILNQYDYVNNPDAMDPDTTDLVPPAGLLFRGKLQKPVILRIDHALRQTGYIGDTDGLDKSDDRSIGCGEEKYLSTSTGKVRTVCEKAVSLGIGDWKEVARDE
ncbi:MAG: PQQ-binding-like beta-propeller repeat protein [Deltaproteobacteria bacterium]|nr:PQQ-binding-like beta-propeller repeat protein [Deltaproteobacteria bacterium]